MNKITDSCKANLYLIGRTGEDITLNARDQEYLMAFVTLYNDIAHSSMPVESFLMATYLQNGPGF